MAEQQKMVWGLQYVGENDVPMKRVVPAAQPAGGHSFTLSTSDPQAMVWGLKYVREE